MRRRPQTLAFLAADFAALGDREPRARRVDALAGHQALTEADVLAALPALPGTAGDEIAASMLEHCPSRAGPARAAGVGSDSGQSRQIRRGPPVLERAAAEGASAPLLIELARTAIRLKDYEGALGYLAHARSLDPGTPPRTSCSPWSASSRTSAAKPTSR